jgi:hypothetical protein
MNTIINHMKTGIDFILNHRAVREIIGNDQNEFKQRVFYFLNIAFMFAINFFKMFYAFMINIIFHFYNTYAGEKVLNKEIVLITGSGGYLGMILSYMLYFFFENIKKIIKT